MAIRGIDGGVSFGGAEGAGREHTVQAGETFEGIAKQYGFPAEELFKSNPQIKDPGSIQPGQVLLLPAVQMDGGSKMAPAAFQGDILERAGKADLFSLDFRTPVAPGEAQSHKFLPADSLQLKLAPEQFETNPSGKLVVKNNELTGLLRTLLQQNSGESLSLNFTRLPGEAQPLKLTGEAQALKISGEAQVLKLPGEAQALKLTGEAQVLKLPGEALADKEYLNFSRLDPSVANFYKEFLERQADPGQVKMIGQETLETLSNALAQAHKSPGEAQSLNFTRLEPTVANFYKEFLNRQAETGQVGQETLKTMGDALSLKYMVDSGEIVGSDRLEAQSLKIAGEAQMHKFEGGIAENQAFDFAPSDAVAIKLTDDLFEINPEGNLIINNDPLANLLKSALGQSQPEELFSFHWEIKKPE